MMLTRFIVVRTLCSLLLLAACSGQKLQNETEFLGKVVAIADGDTFTLLINDNNHMRIRLHGIDCPEKKQDFGQVAKQALAELIFNKQVKVIKTDIDRYGRTIALVYDERNICINEAMLKAGLAWHFLEYDQNAMWDKLEAEAREAGLGLWSHPDPTPPWNWRRK